MGHRRAALVEATTAVEVAIADFAKKPKSQQIFGDILAERLDIPLLKTQFEHLGLSAGVRYLLAVLFTPDQLPTDVLKDCQGAVLERNNVVHSGQRDVKEVNLTKYLISIKHLCELLMNYSAQATD